MSAITPRLCLIGARSAFDRDIAWLQALSRVAAAVSGTATRMATLLQVRVEQERDDVEALARHALDAVRSFAPPALRVVLNAPGVDAHACGYDGLHWPERRVEKTRPPQYESLSASIHSLDALRRAEAASVDFVQFGPIWEPTWKAAQPLGLGALAEVVEAASVPVLAVGGVSPERVAACIQAGAHGVSIVSGMFGASDLEQAASAYEDALRSV